ncbi:Tgt2/MlaC family protein [Paraliomyxa miuraensis]|uniref:Tgt2/MlaC family protein n=1 Tax=Paraliomyxa miuraensis TaxID=376150 RepID=UPI00224EEFC2|nr:ABC transporter substrate-binding protein [Paraliomyxa miuraensis]MCX4241553.1 ABC transporter substrate-binding protein [Paraliomyxa miuraensis]
MRNIIVAAALLGGVLLHSPVVHGLGEPGVTERPGALETFTSTQAELTALVDAHAPAKDVQALVDGLLDYRFIMQAALGGPAQYEARCAPRCDELQALLTALVRRTYVERITTSGRGTVEVVAHHVRDKATKIDTRVRWVEQGQTKVVSVDYVMHEVGGRWLVRDLITEGVSLAKNYRYELLRLHAEGGIDLVITRLERKLHESR